MPQDIVREFKQFRRPRRTKGLSLKVTIPAKIVPLFLALVEISQATSRESVAELAIRQWILSPEVMDVFDDAISNIL